MIPKWSPKTRVFLRLRRQSRKKELSHLTWNHNFEFASTCLLVWTQTSSTPTKSQRGRFEPLSLIFFWFSDFLGIFDNVRIIRKVENSGWCESQLNLCSLRVLKSAFIHATCDKTTIGVSLSSVVPEHVFPYQYLPPQMSFTECYSGKMLRHTYYTGPGLACGRIIAHSEERHYVSGLLNKFNRIIWKSLIKISAVKLRICHISDVEPRLVER